MFIAVLTIHNCILAFSPNVPGNDEIALNAMCDCIQDLKDWMNRVRLKLNDDKTEFVLIGTKQQLEKVNFSSITVGDAVIEAKSEVRNLGSEKRLRVQGIIT